MINLKVRLKNKAFWVSFIPAILLFVQVVANTLGINIDLGELGNQLLEIVNAAFALLTIMGVINDPTTPGMVDSKRAMSYITPGVVKTK